MGNLFISIYNILRRKPGLSISLFLVFILIAVFAVSRLQFIEDINRIVPNNKEVGKMSNVFTHARLMEKVIITVHTKDSTLNPAYVAAFAKVLSDSIEKHMQPNFISGLQGEVPTQNMERIYQLFYDHLPIFLEDNDYDALDSLLTQEQIHQSILADYRALMSPADFGVKKFIKRDPLSLTRLGIEKLKAFQPNDNFTLFDNFVFTSGRQDLLLFITLSQPKESDITNQFEEKLIAISNALIASDYPNIEMEYFGGPLVAAANANQIKKDIIFTVSIAVVILLIVISLFFKSKRAVFIIFTPAILGALVSVAIITVFKSEVSIISLGIGSVLLGISVDFALHMYAHYREQGSIKHIFEDLSMPIIISGITTAAAFLSLTLLKSEVMADLGLFLAISVVSSAIFTLILFPHLLKPIKTSNIERNNWIDHLAKPDLSRNKVLVNVIIGLSILFIFMIKPVPFEKDLSQSNFMTSELKSTEAKINHITGADEYRSLYVTSFASNIEEALQMNENLGGKLKEAKGFDYINQCINISSIVPSGKLQKQRISKWRAYWTKERKQHITNMIIESSKEYGFKESAFSDFYDYINGTIPTLSYDESFLYHQFAKDYVVELDSGYAILSQLDINKSSDKREEVASLFDGNGTMVIDKLHFTQQMVEGLKVGFDKLVFISLSLVFLILLLSFGRIELAIIGFLPVSITWLWITSIMNLFGLQFNIFNVIILSFVFGLGIDYSIFYLRALQLKHMYGKENLRTYRASVILSVITSIVGIGVLIFAKHPAMRSIALMSVIGIITILLLTFTLIPLAFRWLVSYKAGRRLKVITFHDFVTSILFFLGYVTGSLIMTILIPVFMIIPAPRKAKRDFYRFLVKIFSSYIFLHPTIPIKVIKDTSEDFSKPAMIIANHQSVVDIMLMLLLSSKILIVTNERVWKHWLWGAVLRYAEYYPAFSGYGNMEGKLKDKIEQGYSIMIFPEGTRSVNGKIKRFHKGAFYLAESLGLDVLPILLHGVNETLRKGEFFLFSGKITMKILPRIDLKKGDFGPSMREQSKSMTSYFREQYEVLREEVANVDFYKTQLTRNFIYKGPVLEWYFRIKFMMEKRYRYFNSIIPRDAKVIDLGCGYGFLDLMLNIVAPERKIIGVDFDQKKIDLAQNSAIRGENLEFIWADVTQFDIESADVFIILDTLHYFSVEKQLNLIKLCIRNLNPGGFVLIRDANTEIEKRHKSTELTERISTGIGFNKAKFSDLHFISEKVIKNLVRKENMKMEVVSESKHLSNQVYLIRYE